MDFPWKSEKERLAIVGVDEEIYPIMGAHNEAAFQPSIYEDERWCGGTVQVAETNPERPYNTQPGEPLKRSELQASIVDNLKSSRGYWSVWWHSRSKRSRPGIPGDEPDDDGFRSVVIFRNFEFMIRPMEERHPQKRDEDQSGPPRLRIGPGDLKDCVNDALKRYPHENLSALIGTGLAIHPNDNPNYQPEPRVQFEWKIDRAPQDRLTWLLHKWRFNAYRNTGETYENQKAAYEKFRDSLPPEAAAGLPPPGEKPGGKKRLQRKRRSVRSSTSPEPGPSYKRRSVGSQSGTRSLSSTSYSGASSPEISRPSSLAGTGWENMRPTPMMGAFSPPTMSGQPLIYGSPTMMSAEMQGPGFANTGMPFQSPGSGMSPSMGYGPGPTGPQDPSMPPPPPPGFRQMGAGGAGWPPNMPYGQTPIGSPGSTRSGSSGQSYGMSGLGIAPPAPRYGDQNVQPHDYRFGVGNVPTLRPGTGSGQPGQHAGFAPLQSGSGQAGPQYQHQTGMPQGGGGYMPNPQAMQPNPMGFVPDPAAGDSESEFPVAASDISSQATNISLLQQQGVFQAGGGAPQPNLPAAAYFNNPQGLNPLQQQPPPGFPQARGNFPPNLQAVPPNMPGPGAGFPPLQDPSAIQFGGENDPGIFTPVPPGMMPPPPGMLPPGVMPQGMPPGQFDMSQFQGMMANQPAGGLNPQFPYQGPPLNPPGDFTDEDDDDVPPGPPNLPGGGYQPGPQGQGQYGRGRVSGNG